MFEQVKALMAEALNLDVNAIELNASLKDDLEIDSLDAVELILELQDAFDVEVSEEEAQSFKTVNDIVVCLEAKKA